MPEGQELPCSLDTGVRGVSHALGHWQEDLVFCDFSGT